MSSEQSVVAGKTVAVVEKRDILGGQPTIEGTRIPARTIVAYLRDGYSPAQIRDDYPSLPAGGVEAVEAWARGLLGDRWTEVADRLS